MCVPCPFLRHLSLLRPRGRRRHHALGAEVGDQVAVVLVGVGVVEHEDAELVALVVAHFGDFTDLVVAHVVVGFFAIVEGTLGEGERGRVALLYPAPRHRPHRRIELAKELLLEQRADPVAVWAWPS